MKNKRHKNYKKKNKKRNNKKNNPKLKPNQFKLKLRTRLKIDHTN